LAPTYWVWLLPCRASRRRLLRFHLIGIDTFTPIINPPEAAILGVGRIVERIGRRNADLVWQQIMTLSLTFDHRVVDGAPAAAFMQTVRELSESPEALTAA
jgi:pyruvate dehydrogenase E2 component (dihydrolipoamide acetyltransferase)